MSALAATRRLARLADLLATLPSPDAQHHAECLNEWLASEVDLDTACGLTLSRGQSDPRGALKRERRDLILATAADKLSPNGDPVVRARVLHIHLSRYAGGRWRHDRTKDENPYRPDALEHLFFEVFRLVDHLPVAGSLRRILRTTKSVF
jgi:hypothetical protein